MQKTEIYGKVMLVFVFSLVIGILALTGARGAFISIVPSAPGDDTWTNDSTPDFRFTAVSDISTPFSCELFIDDVGKGINSATSNNTATTITANATLNEGARNWYVNCTDASGTNRSIAQIIKIDTIAPTTTPSAVDSTGTSYTFDTWINSPINVTLSCAYGGGSSCSVIRYCNDTTNTCTPDIAYSGVVQISTEGISYIRYHSNDVASNIETTKSKTVKIDVILPTTTASAVESTSVTHTFNAWTNSSYVNITLACADEGGSACNVTRYCRDTANTCTPDITYTGAVEVSTEGTSYIRYYSKDTASNLETTKSKIVKIDTTAPATTASAGDSNGTSYAFDIWTNSSYVNVTLACTDGAGSGCDAILYCNDSADSCNPSIAYGGAMRISAEGTFYVRYKSNDEAGNAEGIGSKAIKIDRTAPNITSFECNPSSVAIGGTVTCLCNAIDNFDTDVGISVTKVNTSAIGAFTEMCTATDDAGNSNSATASYTVRSKKLEKIVMYTALFLVLATTVYFMIKKREFIKENIREWKRKREWKKYMKEKRPGVIKRLSEGFLKPSPKAKE